MRHRTSGGSPFAVAQHFRRHHAWSFSTNRHWHCLAGSSYAGARFTAGKVVGPQSTLGPVSPRFAFDGVASLPAKPRAWIMAYPRPRASEGAGRKSTSGPRVTFWAPSRAIWSNASKPRGRPSRNETQQLATPNARGRNLKIWIDADAAPRDVKELVFRASRRLGIETILVANQRLTPPAGNSPRFRRPGRWRSATWPTSTSPSTQRPAISS